MQRNRVLRGLIVLAILAGAGLVASEVWRAEQRRIETANNALARQAADTASRVVEVAAGSLRGSQGLLDAQGQLYPSGFRRFARGVLEESPFKVLTWQPAVPPTRRARFERLRLRRPIYRLGEDGRTRLQAGERAFPVHYVWPLSGGNRRALGFDVSSDPVRWRAAKLARDSGMPRATEPVRTVVGADPGIVVHNPLYNPGRRIGSTGHRRRNLRGFVSGAMVLSRLQAETLGFLPDDISLRIVDAGTPVIDTGLPEEHLGAAETRVAGRLWQVAAAGGKTPSAAGPIAIALGGLALALLAAVLFAVADRREAALERRRRLAERDAAREGLQARVADVLERGLTVRERLDALAQELVPALADVCVVDVDYGDRGWHRVAVAAHREQLREQLAAASRGPGASEAAAGARSQRLAAAEADRVLLDRNGSGPQPPLELASALALPLSARGRRLGVMVLGLAGPAGAAEFTADEVEQLRDIATRAALALDSARLYERERTAAQTLQKHLLPSHLPQPESIEVAAAYRAGGEEVQVGGDFYDLFRVPGSWVAVVGDVCGSGAEAASLTSLLRHTLRTGSRLSDPEHALMLVDAAAREETEGATFLTLAAVWLDDTTTEDGRLQARVAVAGHPEPRLVRPDGGITRIAPNGPLLGVVDEWSAVTTRVELRPGDTLLLFTDGITEARRDGQIFGDDRLDECLRSQAGSAPAELVRALEAAVMEWAGGEVHDDLALFALRPRPPAG